MITANLPVLVVVVPFLAGLATPLLGRGDRGWYLSLAVSWAVFALTLLLMGQVSAAPGGVVSYPLGNWEPPWGIEYRVDRLNAFVLVVVAGMTAMVTTSARESVALEVPADRRHFFYAAYLLCLTGLLGITVTGDAFNVYVLLEIASLTTYALVAMGKSRDRRALTASLQYLIMGSLGASFLLLGIGYLLQATGTLNMADIAAQLEVLERDRAVRVAYALILVGLSLKMALFPVHGWLPGAYTHAPTAVSAFLASTATKVGIYVTLRFVFTIFGPDFSIGLVPTDGALIGLSTLAILVGSILAIRQTNLKRLLAYSSVAQIGYMVLGIGLATADGLTGALVHLLNHALVKGALFIGAGAVVCRLGGADLRDLRGLGRRMPWTAAGLTLSGLGLVGVPLTGGFVSKWYLVAGCLQRQLWPIAVVVLIGSLLAVIYVGRVIDALYWRDPEPGAPTPRGREPLAMVVPAWALGLASVWLGVAGGPATAAAGAAARGLLAGSAP